MFICNLFVSVVVMLSEQILMYGEVFCVCVLNIYNKTLLTPAASSSTSQWGLFANESVVLTLQRQHALYLCPLFSLSYTLCMPSKHIYMHLNANMWCRSLGVAILCVLLFTTLRGECAFYVTPALSAGAN